MLVNRKKYDTRKASKVSGMRLPPADFESVQNEMKVSGENESDVLRSLIHEALHVRRMKRGGQRDADEKYRVVIRQMLCEENEKTNRQLDETLNLLRWQSGMLERIWLRTGEGVGVSFENLKVIECLAAMVRRDLTRARLEAAGESKERIDETIRTLTEKFEARAQEKFQGVQLIVRESPVGPS